MSDKIVVGGATKDNPPAVLLICTACGYTNDPDSLQETKMEEKQ